MARVNQWRLVGAIAVCLATAMVASAQDIFTTLLSFDGTNGSGSLAALIQGSDGNFYGVGGIVYKLTPSGKLTKLHRFCTLARCADGEEPQGALVQGTNGKFYGTTLTGGSGPDGCGTVFEITAAGKLTTLHTFDEIDGCGPYSGLVQAANGNFYGTTYVGGVHQGVNQKGGTVFKITGAGEFTSLYSFCSLTNCADGSFPLGSLVQGTDGNFYGTTGLRGVGSNCSGSQYSDGCGTIFRLTQAGKLTTLYSFCSLANCADGNYPTSALVQATDGNFYGTTFTGGACGTRCGYGTVFEITPTGAMTTLYNFCTTTDCADGAALYAGLLQATNGTFYGTTEEGGASNDGVIFSLNTGLAPFVSFIRNPAKVGQQFGILGYGLSGTSGVVFNGTSASFTAKSDTLLIATVPSGATTGYVTVITPTGTLTGNVPFRVIR